MSVQCSSSYFVKTELPQLVRPWPDWFLRPYVLKMFIVVADVFEWCINHESVEHVFHYLDDLAVLGPNLTESDEELHTIQKTATELEFLLAADKQDGLTTEIVFLSIVIDTGHQEL